MPTSFSTFLKKLFLQNIGLKITALLLATISWYAIRGVISHETVVENVSLKILHNDGWAVLEHSTGVVDVEFRGAREDLIRLNKDNVELIVDLRGHESAGASSIMLTPAMVVASRSARVHDIEPNEIMIRLDRQSTRLVPVKIDIQGAVPDGYDIVDVSSDPTNVVVSGPHQRIDQVTEIRTAPITIDSLTGSLQTRVELTPPSDRWLAKLDPSRINVYIAIQEQSEIKLFKDRKINVLIDPALEAYEAELAPNVVNVSIKAGTERLASLEENMIRPYVDCSQLKPGQRYKLPIMAHLPDGTHLVTLEPSHVRVVINKVP